MTRPAASPSTSPEPRRLHPSRAWHVPLASLVFLLGCIVAASALDSLREFAPVLLALAIFLFVADALFQARGERLRWIEPIGRLARDLRDLNGGGVRLEPPEASALGGLVRAINDLRLGQLAVAKGAEANLDESWMGPWEKLASPGPPLTRSGLFETPPPSRSDAKYDPNASGDFSTTEMVNRLDPVDLRWMESSQAEQEFLGWSLDELRGKVFPDIVHPDDRELAPASCRRPSRKGSLTASSTECGRRGAR